MFSYISWLFRFPSLWIPGSHHVPSHLLRCLLSWSGLYIAYIASPSLPLVFSLCLWFLSTIHTAEFGLFFFLRGGCLNIYKSCRLKCLFLILSSFVARWYIPCVMSSTVCLCFLFSGNIWDTVFLQCLVKFTCKTIWAQWFLVFSDLRGRDV